MDFLSRLLNRPSPKLAICDKSPTHQSVGEVQITQSQPTDSVSDQQQQQQQQRLSREFSEATSSGPSSLVHDSLSSASSFQSLASTLSSKSSSGICADSAPASPDKQPGHFDRSYVDVDIPGLGDLISACANINLNSTCALQSVQADAETAERAETAESGDCSVADLSPDQTFTSAADDTIGDRTHVNSDAIQTFKTCPALDATQEHKVASSDEVGFKVPLPVEDLVSPTSIVPDASFEESGLHKQQNNPDETTSNAEFKSALTSFIVSQPRICDPIPGEEIEVAETVKNYTISDSIFSSAHDLAASSPVPPAGQRDLQNNEDLDSPDVSFDEVHAFDSTVILSPVSKVKELNIDTPDKLKNTLLETQVFSWSPLPTVNVSENEKFKTPIRNLTSIQKEYHSSDSEATIKTENILNRTVDYNETRVTVQDRNSSNQSNIVGQEIQTQNNNQAIVLDETCIINSKEKNDLSKTVNTEENNILIEADTLVEKRNLCNQNINETTQNITTNSEINKNEEQLNETTKLEEDQIKYNPCILEKQNSNLLNAETIVSTCSPDKSSIEINIGRSPENKTTLLSQEQIFSKPEETPSINQGVETTKTEKFIVRGKEQESLLGLDQTVAVNRSVDKSFSALETVIKESLEETKLLNTSVNLLPTKEPEYEAFKPQQQSTTLPLPDSCDFEVLEEAALSVSRDIENSFKIEETEQFVSATNELFGDPSDLDFLNQAGSQTSKRGERYDSLFMRFDPLAQRLSMLPQKNLPTPSVDEEKDKETKVELPITDMGTPKKNPALAAIDRLLFYSPCAQNSNPESEVVHPNQETKEEEKPDPQMVPVVDENMAKELELVRSTVLQLEEELEKQKREQKEQLDRQKVSFEGKFTQLQEKLAQEVKCKEQMTVVVEEYEKSISKLIAEREKDRTNFETEKAKLQEELQVAQQHLSNIEAAFNDVHTKYERLKNIVTVYKSNEAVLKESIAENQDTIKTLENKYEQLKSHAMAQLEKANLELNSIRKHNDADNVKLKALLRKAELKSKSLEETVEQKMKENMELTKIIDEMIARVDD